jgi:hypothetical protein
LHNADGEPIPAFGLPPTIQTGANRHV